MAKTICIASNSAGCTANVNTTTYYAPGGSLYDTPTTSSTANRVPFRTAGTLSNLQIVVITNTVSANSTLVTYKNGAAGGQTATITASTTGIFEDTTNTDSITAGNTLAYRLITGATGTSVIVTAMSTVFAATTNTVTKLICSHPNAGTFIPSQTAATTYYYPLAGSNSHLNTTEANAKIRMRKAGTFKNLAIQVNNSLSGSSGSTMRLRKNGADVITISVANNTTGLFEETSTTSSCAVDDDFNFAMLTETGQAAPWLNFLTIEFETTDSSGLVVAGQMDNAGGVTANFVKGTTNYISIGGVVRVGTTTEANIQTKPRETFTFSDLEIFCSAVSGTTNNTLTLRNGAVDTALVVTISTATGLYQDTTHTVGPVVATDLLDYKLINTSAAGGTHNITVEWIAIFYTGAAAVTIPQTIMIEWEES